MRANKMPPMSIENIIRDAEAEKGASWSRCKQVLDFALQTAKMSSDDLEQTDGFLRYDGLDDGPAFSCGTGGNRCGKAAAIRDPDVQQHP